MLITISAKENLKEEHYRVLRNAFMNPGVAEKILKRPSREEKNYIVTANKCIFYVPSEAGDIQISFRKKRMALNYGIVGSLEHHTQECVFRKKYFSSVADTVYRMTSGDSPTAILKEKLSSAEVVVPTIFLDFRSETMTRLTCLTTEIQSACKFLRTKLYGPLVYSSSVMNTTELQAFVAVDSTIRAHILQKRFLVADKTARVICVQCKIFVVVCVYWYQNRRKSANV